MFCLSRHVNPLRNRFSIWCIEIFIIETHYALHSILGSNAVRAVRECRALFYYVELTPNHEKANERTTRTAVQLIRLRPGAGVARCGACARGSVGRLVHPRLVDVDRCDLCEYVIRSEDCVTLEAALLRNMSFPCALALSLPLARQGRSELEPGTSTGGLHHACMMVMGWMWGVWGVTL